MNWRKYMPKVLLAAALLVIGMIPAPGALAQGGPAEIHIHSTDAAPASGTLEVYINYNYDEGEPFWPAGHLVEIVAVSAGQQLDVVLTGYPYGVNARVWFTPAGGQPSLLPSQYYPDGEFGTATADADDARPIYLTSFANAVPGVAPLDLSTADAPAFPTEIQSFDLDDGTVEWGYWDPEDERFVVLGWTWWAGDARQYDVPDDGPVTVDELIQIVAKSAPAPLLSGGELRRFDLDDDLTEWGYWAPNDDGEVGAYTLLGWSQPAADGTVSCFVPADGPVTEDELCQLITSAN